MKLLEQADKSRLSRGINATRNSFKFITDGLHYRQSESPHHHKYAFWVREVDDVYCLWQYGHETIPIFLAYLNSIESRIQWTMEIEQEDHLPFVDLNLCRQAYRITAGIYRKKIPHTEVLYILVK